MSRVSRSALLLVLLFTLAPTAFSQGNTFGSIVGEVKVVAGHAPVGRLEVKLYNAAGVPLVTYTDTEGHYNFSDLQFNSYTVVVDDDRYQPARQSVIISNLTTQNAFISLWLVPKETDKSNVKDGKNVGANPYMVSATEFLKHYPKNAVKAYEEGVKQRDAGHWEEAVLKFKSALEAAPGFYEARNNLGTVYVSRGFYPAAENEFLKVIEEQRTDANAYFNLGNVYLLTDRLTESEQQVQEGLRRQPNDPFGLFLLGTLYNRKGNIKEAESTLQNALTADPSLSKVHLELVNLYLKEQKKPEAIEELKLFLDKFPKDPMADKAKQVLARLTDPTAN